MKLFTVWMEGYAATGESAPARIFARVPDAETLDEACDILYEDPQHRHLMKRRKDGTWSYWGCQFFDNEQDARKNFG